MIDFGQVIKRNDNDFVVMADVSQYDSGYNVVPKTVDPDNKYDIEDVRQYCDANPDKVFDDYEPVPEPVPSAFEKLEAQVLFTALMTDTVMEE